MGNTFSRSKPAVPKAANEDGAPIPSDLESIVQGGHNDAIEYPDLPVEDTPDLYGMPPKPDQDDMPATLEWYNERYRRRAAMLGLPPSQLKENWAGSAIASLMPSQAAEAEMTEGDLSSDSDSSAESDAPTVHSGEDEDQYYTGGRYKKRKQRAGSAASDESLIGVRKDKPLKTEHELDGPVYERPIEVLPPREGKLVLLGTIISVVQTVVVVQAQHPNGECLEEGSLLCLQDRKVIGPVFETFGPLESPFYSIRLSSPDDYLLVPQHGDPVSTAPILRTGLEVYYSPTSEHVTVIRTNEINRSKGTDASNIYDEEPGADEIEFSDDEAERAYKASLRVAKVGRKEKDRRKLEAKLAKERVEGGNNDEGGEEYTPLRRPGDGFPLPARPPVGTVLENPEEIGIHDSIMFSDGDSIMGDSKMSEDKRPERNEDQRSDRGEGSSRGWDEGKTRGQERGRGRGRGAKRGRGGKDVQSSSPRSNGVPTGPRGGGNWRGNDRNDRGRDGRDDRGRNTRGRGNFQDRGPPGNYTRPQTGFDRPQNGFDRPQNGFDRTGRSFDSPGLPPPPPGLPQPPSGMTYPLPLPPRGMLPPASLAMSGPGPMSMLPLSSPMPPPPFPASSSAYNPSAPSPMNSPGIPVLQPPPAVPSPSTSHNRKWSNPALKAKTEGKEASTSDSKPASPAPSPLGPTPPTSASTSAFPAQPFSYGQAQFPGNGFPSQMMFAQHQYALQNQSRFPPPLLSQIPGISTPAHLLMGPGESQDYVRSRGRGRGRGGQQ